ncbi:MAG: transposase [Cyanobacteria bacterium P01_G01_bin.54]
MPNYRRGYVHRGTYFITQVTYRRERWLCTESSRQALRAAISHTQQKHPFVVEAFVLLPEHWHGLLRLPEGDGDISMRMRLIKAYVTRHYGAALGIDRTISESRRKRKEQNLWQRRFYEHLIRDERDFETHCDYLHYNPVKHGLCQSPQDWPFSTVHNFIKRGIYPPDWGRDINPDIPHSVWDR